MAVLFATCVCILAAGFIWFYVARPILEGYGLIAPVKDNQDAPAPLMSRLEDAPAPSAPSSLETGRQTDRQTEESPRIRAEELLPLFTLMRAAGVGREDAQAAFKAAGLPFNNNVWAKAAPAQHDGAHVTPIVGRRTNAVFETDPDFPYQAPA